MKSKEKQPEQTKCPKCGGAVKRIHPKQVLRCQTCGYLVEEKEE